MSNVQKAIDQYIEQKLWNIHTAFLAKVTAVKGNLFDVKPLLKAKEYGGKEFEQPVIEDVPRIKHRLTVTTEACPNPTTYEVKDELRAGDIVLCVAHERELGAVLGGSPALPLSGIRHNLNDAIIVGLMDL